MVVVGRSKSELCLGRRSVYIVSQNISYDDVQDSEWPSSYTHLQQQQEAVSFHWYRTIGQTLMSRPGVVTTVQTKICTGVGLKV
jgi:hypothetical protein